MKNESERQNAPLNKNVQSKDIQSKPGGGGMLQPFIPKGNGTKSGEYTVKRNLIRRSNVYEEGLERGDKHEEKQCTSKPLRHLKRKPSTSNEKFDMTDCEKERQNAMPNRSGVRNEEGKYNSANILLVSKVETISEYSSKVSIKSTGSPNSVIKKIIDGYVITERYYNEMGEAYLDIDYSNHGNAKKHHDVPHIHRWIKDENGYLIRLEQEEIKK